jgi:hypothetical protein
MPVVCTAREGEADMAISDDEWNQRLLCPDGNCIGIIGADGRCKVCGLKYEGEMPLPVAEADGDEDQAGEPHAPADQPETDENVQAADDPPNGLAASEEAGDWEDRTLCIDESCIGVVGPDGHCKECGKPYKG